jgi:hypothetical protein
MFAFSDAFSAVANAASPLTRSAHAISRPLRRPLSASVKPSGDSERTTSANHRFPLDLPSAVVLGAPASIWLPVPLAPLLRNLVERPVWREVVAGSSLARQGHVQLRRAS